MRKSKGNHHKRRIKNIDKADISTNKQQQTKDKQRLKKHAQNQKMHCKNKYYWVPKLSQLVDIRGRPDPKSPNNRKLAREYIGPFVAISKPHEKSCIVRKFDLAKKEEIGPKYKIAISDMRPTTFLNAKSPSCPPWVKKSYCNPISMNEFIVTDN